MTRPDRVAGDANDEVAGDENVRLFCGLRLPDDAADAIVAWQAGLERGRIVPRDNLHFTLAFLGRQPRSRLDEVVEALRRRCAETRPPVFEVDRYRETRSVGMLVFTRDERRGTARARSAGAICSAAPSATRGFRTSPFYAFANDRGSGRRCPGWSRS